jgi:hypothetical protein
MSDGPRVCRICGVRRPKRYCPGVSGDICAICCGTEREVTVNCPLECPYLEEARKHEPQPAVNPRDFPNNDIRVDEGFLRKNEALLILISSALGRAALEHRGVIDNDVKDALTGLVRTWRTLESGLVYDARPDNPLAARVYTSVQEELARIGERVKEHGQSMRDADVLGILAFLQRMEIQHNNGKPKGRAFIHFLIGFLPAVPGERDGGSVETSGGGLIITP